VRAAVNRGLGWACSMQVTTFPCMHRVVETRLADINMKTDGTSTESHHQFMNVPICACATA